MSENGTHRCWDHEDCPHRWCDGELQQQDRFNVMCLDCELIWTHVRYPPTHTEPPKDQLTDADGEVWAEKRAVATDGGQDARVGSGVYRHPLDGTERHRMQCPHCSSEVSVYDTSESAPAAICECGTPMNEVFDT